MTQCSSYCYVPLSTKLRKEACIIKQTVIPSPKLRTQGSVAKISSLEGMLTHLASLHILPVAKTISTDAEG